MVFEIWCSWCGKFMGKKEGAGSDFAEKLKNMGLPVVSNSICPKCKKALRCGGRWGDACTLPKVFGEVQTPP